MRHRWRLEAGWVCLACSACPAFARAAEPGHGIELVWHAPSGCPDEAWARKAVDAYLGHRKRDAFKPIAVRVAITAVPGGRWRATLSLGGGSGDRVFEGGTCARVGDAAVLIVALMLDPVEVVTQIETPGAAAPRVPAATADAGGRRAADGRPPRSVQVAIQAAGDAGSFPEPTVGAGLAGGVRIGRASFLADVVAWIPRRAFGGPTAGSGGDIGLYTASLRGCFTAMRAYEGRIALEPCFRLEGGLASGRGFGIAEPMTTHPAWGAAFVGLSIRQMSTESLGAWLSVEGGVPFLRPNYVIEQFGTVFRASPVLARLSFGLAWSFP
jgi:hypothetical protein